MAIFFVRYNVSMNTPTKKQRALLKFIQDFSIDHDFSPSYREIQSAMGLKSVSAVAEHINNLITKGAIKKVPGAARSLEVVDLSHPETTTLFKARLLSATEEESQILHSAAEILGIDLNDA